MTLIYSPKTTLVLSSDLSKDPSSITVSVRLDTTDVTLLLKLVLFVRSELLNFLVDGVVIFCLDFSLLSANLNPPNASRFMAVAGPNFRMFSIYPRVLLVFDFGGSGIRNSAKKLKWKEHIIEH